MRAIGCSNFSAEQLREAAEAAVGARFVSVQNHYNALHRDDDADVLPECDRLGITYIPYFPLASGLLTGKYQRGAAPPDGTRLANWGERAKPPLSDTVTIAVCMLRLACDARGGARIVRSPAFAEAGVRCCQQPRRRFWLWNGAAREHCNITPDVATAHAG